MSITVDIATTAGELLKSRGQSIGVAESSSGGLISASLLAVPGASAYFQGSTVIYTLRARRELLGIPRDALARQEPLSTAYVELCATTIRERLRADWGLAELGASGPAGTPYGHPPGICVLAVSGPVTLSRRLETGHGDRATNMVQFTRAAIALLVEALDLAG